MYYTTSQVANRYGVDSSTVRRWVEKGLLTPACTTPGGHHRFSASEVERAIKQTA
ncbi:MAG: helix-turn-helix domain-containing protein [Nocardiaceae bacterium]|nr:helix-turn-helix domain-containing protein [Nocardiaceae bacterium]